MRGKDMSDIRERLFSLADVGYREFHSGLCPGTGNIIGVRVPVLRTLAKEIAREGDFLDFLSCDTEYYEETMLAGMLIGFIKDFDAALEYIRGFVPKIDNWAICDVFCGGLKITKKHYDEMLEFILPYLESEKEFEARFAVVMLLSFYATDEYIERVIKYIDGVRHTGYYAQMAVAWAVSVCYIKFPQITMKYLSGENSLDDFTFNKSLSKITESLRVSNADKAVIRSMKRKKKE